MTAHHELEQALENLESTLRSVDLWNTARPEPEAFDSREPFCVDRMELPQWLRYVFIPRLQALIDARATLPATCQVAPAAEAYLQASRTSTRAVVVAAVAEVDRIVTEA
ncbi:MULTISPECIES: YqcC family protein [Modicisalibacter]|uniref:YqcC family protein n=1 Tax=Modicisalibacter TaxID=574347 RepID=UPI00100B9C51|nr:MULTISPECIES: YqcC family protein [Halomonadaceae]MBZ9557401.1 YqcC family protein [Modicisalibacter sp. R2A 31.J]MBZ9573933.1 YqcC family protein [Modicisalibacter sp. MOD 31.J]